MSDKARELLEHAADLLARYVQGDEGERLVLDIDAYLAEPAPESTPAGLCPDCKHLLSEHERDDEGPPHVCHRCYAESDKSDGYGHRWCWMGEPEMGERAPDSSAPMHPVAHGEDYAAGVGAVPPEPLIEHEYLGAFMFGDRCRRWLPRVADDASFGIRCGQPKSRHTPGKGSR